MEPAFIDAAFVGTPADQREPEKPKRKTKGKRTQGRG